MTPVSDHRPHTGRRRNEAARAAILKAAVDLLMTGADASTTTIDTLASAAGVGRQTIYRWWPSKGAVLLEAMIERANLTVPVPDTGSLRSDLHTFLGDTFRAAGNNAAALRGVIAEAQRDQHTATMLSEFVAQRRAALLELFTRAISRGELPADAAVDLLIDQAYGVLWYRMLTGRGSLDADAAAELATALAGKASG
jgi:AcrR family transcriptional regulator